MIDLNDCLITFLFILICTVCAGFFAGLETGLVTANRVLLQKKKIRGVLYARAAEYLLTKPDRLLGTTLIGCNIANVTAAVLFTNFLVRIGLERVAWLGILFMALLFLIFNDFIPKSFFRKNADTISVKLAPILISFFFIFQPFYVVLNGIIKVLLLVTGQLASRREELQSKRDIRFLINLTGKEVGLPPQDQKIIEDIFDFRDQTAREVMVPFHELPVININQTLKDAAQLSIDTGYRFIPVSEVRTDNMVGYLDTLEMLWKKDNAVRDIMRTPVFFPETRRISDLLLNMNQKELEVVFLSDEYGGIAGMITPGQIVGDLVHYIPEEGTRKEEIRTLEPGHYLVSGSTDLEDISHEIGIVLRQGYNRTIGGLICEKLGMIPEKGYIYEDAGFIFRITKRDERHIKEIEVTSTSISR